MKGEFKMTQTVFRELLDVMRSRGGPYAGLDIPEFFVLVEEIFDPEEAEINNALPRKPASVEEIAAKTGRSPEEVSKILEEMAARGLCGVSKTSGGVSYRGLPFMPGIFEFIFIGGGETEREKTIARLIHTYKKAYSEAIGVENIAYPVTRVIPVARTIKAGNTIHTYDQVMAYIDKYDFIGVGACYCRHAAKLRGEELHGMPIGVCMWFGEIAKNITERLGGRQVTREEAKQIVSRCEEAGLIHMSRNTTDEIDFMCNCDRWHCEVVGQVLKQPRPGLVFNSGFEPSFDAERCVVCETCIERCPAEALTMGETNVPVVNTDRCFGCGVCATGCPESAIEMVNKPGFPVPPKTVKELVKALKG
jgi:Pyruvate/2-oxoacid:ferredoxin oxidoreductase delta subunit/DNA-binding MarR family transcriptional regulator